MADDTARSTFSIPPALKKLFDSFPLLTYPANALPARCPRPSSTPKLYTFTAPSAAARGDPSFNPTCLKWQTYLKFCEIPFETVSSSNHASPSGSLPFLVARKDSGTAILTGAKIQQWARENGKRLKEIDVEDAKVQAFLTLLGTQIRDAWLYALMLEPSNYASLAAHQYRSTAVPLVSSLLSHQTQSAARDDLKKYRPGGMIGADDIYADAASAFDALATILGDGDWFFDGEEPGLFDAAVFGYTHLILTLSWDETEAELKRAVMKHGNLIAHEERIRRKYYPDSGREKV
ncbi:hypothetical protein RUND412_001009 [Rhizina undulata]